MDLEGLKSKTFYEVLGVPADASTEQIRDVYKELARIYHPDSNFYDDIAPGKASADQVQVFKIITAAYNTLSDADKRADYDRTIAPLLSLHTKVRKWEDESRDEITEKLRRASASSGGQRRKMSGVFGRLEDDEPLVASPEPSPTRAHVPSSPRKLTLSAFMVGFGLTAGIVAGVICVILFLQH